MARVSRACHQLYARLRSRPRARSERGSERQVALIAASAATDGGQSQKHPVDHHADYLCPICMAAAGMGNALAPGPPALP